MEDNSKDSCYGKGFYDAITDGSVRSAEIILKILYDVYKPENVLDVGCGQGSWLAVAEALGSRTLTGMDGGWVQQDRLVSRNIRFIPTDFETDLALDTKHDLCISLEVAEHISESRAAWFINSLCRASDVVLFGAAVEFQGGTNHINEQWQSYWINLFQANNYNYYDIFRGNVWRNEKVEWWYRQNTFLFVRSGADCIDTKALRRLEKPLLDVVHPVHYYSKVKYSLQLLKKLGSKSS